SGIIANWFINCGEEHLTELFPMRPELVGQPSADVVMGKGSGIDSVKWKLEQMQIPSNDEQAMAVLQAVKQFGLTKKRLMNDDEFRKVARDALSAERTA
ncbi:MAG: pyruvate carboxyltransferase, partial [Gammaproteobacteria bacterium]